MGLMLHTNKSLSNRDQLLSATVIGSSLSHKHHRCAFEHGTIISGCVQKNNTAYQLDYNQS